MRLLPTKSIVYLSPVIIYLLNLIFIFWPKLFFISFSLTLLILVFTLKQITLHVPGFWLSYTYLPVFLVLGMMVYVILLSNRLLVHAIVAITVILAGIYLYNIYYFGKEKFQELKNKHFFDHFTFALSVLALFFLSASIYGLSIFLDWSFVYLSLAFIILSLIIFSQPFLAQVTALRLAGLWIVINTWLLFQFFVIIYFLPLNFNLLALILTIIFYLLLYIFRLYLKNKLNLRNLQYPIIINIILIIAVLLTSRWL